MILSFKTHFPWPGADGLPEPTNFKEKILNAVVPLPEPGPEMTVDGLALVHGDRIYLDQTTLQPILPARKLHTIRRVPASGPRFKEGMKLQFATGPRFKKVVFAETVCTGVQEVKLRMFSKWIREYDPEFGNDVPSLGLTVAVNRMPIEDLSLKQLALNDGLDIWDFTKWFLLDLITHGPGLYQIVHWTDVRY